MTKEKITLDRTEEENVNICYTAYYLTYNGLDVKVTKTQRYSDLLGENDEEYNFECEKELTEEQEEEIKDFIGEN